MKLFLRNTISFILLFLLLMHVVAYTGVFKRFVLGAEVYHSINKSKQSHQADSVLLLGDSVANQLFDSHKYNGSINSLACNQAISMVGQFILLKNYLEQNNKPRKVVMIYSPFSLRNNLDQIYTFNYFLKPFSRAENKPWLTAYAKNQIDKIPFNQLASLPLVYATNWAPFYQPDEVSSRYLSPITLEYLAKIVELTKKNGVMFELIPPPTRDSRQNEVRKVQQETAGIRGLGSIFNGYFNKMLYLSDANFSDPVHLKKPQAFTHLILERL